MEVWHTLKNIRQPDGTNIWAESVGFSYDASSWECFWLSHIVSFLPTLTAPHVRACEWNPNTVEGFRQELEERDDEVLPKLYHIQETCSLCSKIT